MRRALLVGLLALTLPACGEPDSKPITDVRERAAREPAVPPGIDAATRLGLGQDPHAGIPGFGGMSGGMNMPGAGAHGGAGATFAFKVPTGWRPLPPGPGRDAGFVAGAGDATRITVSRAGGDLLANVNRWRGQMGQAPIAQEALAALPTRELLGEKAVRVEIAGSFTGMRGDKIADATMLGLVVPRTRQSVFVKMVGPTAGVEAERENFEAFATSLTEAGAGARPTGHPPMGGQPTQAGTTPPKPLPTAKLSWDTPEGWTALETSPPRVATFKPEGAEQAECLVTILRGSGGGVAANMNEWRRQMGQEKLSPNEYASLKRMPLLGVEAVYIAVKGHYQGKSGEDETDAMLYGLIAPREHDTVFVKMVGPAAEMAGQEERFLALCRSLRE